MLIAADETIEKDELGPLVSKPSTMRQESVMSVAVSLI